MQVFIMLLNISGHFRYSKLENEALPKQSFFLKPDGCFMFYTMSKSQFGGVQFD